MHYDLPLPLRRRTKNCAESGLHMLAMLVLVSDTAKLYLVGVDEVAAPGQYAGRGNRTSAWAKHDNNVIARGK